MENITLIAAVIFIMAFVTAGILKDRNIPVPLFVKVIGFGAFIVVFLFGMMMVCEWVQQISIDKS